MCRVCYRITPEQLLNGSEGGFPGVFWGLTAFGGVFRLLLGLVGYEVLEVKSSGFFVNSDFLCESRERRVSVMNVLGSGSSAYNGYM